MKFHRLIAAIAIGLSVLSAPLLAADTRNCTADEKAKADRQLWLSKRDAQASVDRHLPWGMPKLAAGEQLLVQRDYVVAYSDTLRVPMWTAHRLSSQGLGKEERVNCFRRDERLNKSVASYPADYDEPVFDQGHMVPSSDMSRALNPALNSFIMSNMTPQFCQFNRGVWQIFESIVRLYAKEKKTVYVMIGSVFDQDRDGERDADGEAKRMVSKNGKRNVAIPTHFYKVVVAERPDKSLDVLSVLLPHDQTDLDGAAALRYLADHVEPLTKIEKLVGLKFFPGATVTLHQPTEKKLWPIVGEPRGSLATSAQCRGTAGAAPRIFGR